MSEYRLFNLIGVFIFGGIGLMVFLQTEQFKYRLESGLFFLTLGIVYFVLVMIFYKKRDIFTYVISTLALLAFAMIFVQLFFFGSSH